MGNGAYVTYKVVILSGDRVVVGKEVKGFFFP